MSASQMHSSLMAGEDDSVWPNDGNRFDCYRMLADRTTQSCSDSNKQAVILMGNFRRR